MNALKHHLTFQKLRSYLNISSTVQDALNIMKNTGTSYVVIQDKGKDVGFFTDADLKNRVTARKLPVEKTLLSEVMTKNIICLDVDSSIEDGLSKLEKYDLRYLPVSKKGHIISVLSASHLLKLALKLVSQEREYLMEYISA
jgi:CBS domain-containing protein